MLKRTWALIALVYLVFAEILSLHPVPDLSLCLVEPEHSQQPSNHSEEKHCPAFHVGAALAFEKADSWLERHDKSVIGTFTIVLAISTIGLWLATNKLWSAGENQLTHSRQSSERELRAYVFVSMAKLSNAIDGQRPNIKVTLKNTGQTPAFNLRVQMTMGYAPFPNHEPPNIDHYPFGPPRALAPQAEVHFNQKLDLPMTADGLSGIKANRCALYLIGRACYRDTFGTERWSRFCLFGGGDLEIADDGTGSIAAFLVGNTSDDDPG